MANKNCLVRNIERNEEPEGVTKLTEPCVISFGHWNFKIVEKMTRCGKPCYNILKCKFKI